jgi:integrase
MRWQSQILTILQPVYCIVFPDCVPYAHEMRPNASSDDVRPTGHLQVKGGPQGRVWYAFWRDADGRHRTRLGPAHVRDSGRKTLRGAVIWWAGNGRTPAGHLTPADAEAALQALLAAAARSPTDPRRKRREDHTFAEACEAWLDYVAHEKDRRPSTVRDYRNTVRRYLIAEFRADTLLHTIDTERVDAFRERMLAERHLSRRTIQKILVLLHGIFKRAKRKGWIASNPAEDAERVNVRRTGEFTVLSPEEVHAVARAEPSELRAAVYLTAAFAGLRMGELRGLRWMDVDFGKRLVHVRRNYTSDTFGAPKSQRVRSVPMSDPVARVLDALSRREDGTRPEDLVFSPGYNVPFDDDTVRKRFYAALDAAGLGRLRTKDDPIVFHDLRHTFGTLAVQAFALSDVKAMMGHADISTTMIYVHHVPQTDAAARLSALLETGDGVSTPAPRRGLGSSQSATSGVIPTP